MRELLLGLTVVAADGTVLTGGGRVVKNVTGYDMPKLHVGALGTLGVVVAAHLRLHAVSPIEETWLYGFPSHEAALDAALGVLDSPIVPSRVQTVDEGVLGAPNDAPTAGLAVTIGSVAEGVRAQGDRLRDIARRHGGVSLRGAGAGWWERWSAATWVEDPARQLTARLGCRPTDLVKARRSVEAALGGHGQLAATAGVASGVLHLVVTLREGHDGAGLIPRMRERVDALGATLVVEHAPPEVKATLDAWGDVGPTIGIMRRLKAELDPRRILNPGRFVGGI
jgi:glycolate oxidase FAD binding subunit